MAEKAERKKFWKKFKHKYRLSIYRDETYEEVLNLKLTRLNVVALISGGIFLFLAIVFSIIAYTPVREFIPGYPSEQTVRNIYLNNLRLDSLEIEIEKRDAYFENIRRIISGEEPVTPVSVADSQAPRTTTTLSRTTNDSLIRGLIEPNDQFDLSITQSRNLRPAFFNVLFFPPIKGMVTNSFNSAKNHYGVDIVATSDEVVKATLPGTVTMTGWTLETGHVIQLQHEDNILSIYKHNAALLKQMGDHVKAGESIAIIGNSGELTTGPHLHFELWYKGTPINPEDYISF